MSPDQRLGFRLFAQTLDVRQSIRMLIPLGFNYLCLGEYHFSIQTHLKLSHHTPNGQRDFYSYFCLDRIRTIVRPYQDNSLGHLN